MNPHIILWSIKDLIEGNEMALLADLESNGEAKRIAQVTTSRHTRVRDWIFVGIVAQQVVETYDASRYGNTVAYSHIVNQAANNRYTIELDIADYAVAQLGEETGGEYEEFEKDAETFWTFVSRMVQLFRTNTSIPAHSGNFTIEVYGDGTEFDRRIQVEDLSATITDGSGRTEAALYARLTFDVGTCGEPSPLA